MAPTKPQEQFGVRLLTDQSQRDVGGSWHLDPNSQDYSGRTQRLVRCGTIHRESAASLHHQDDQRSEASAQREAEDGRKTRAYLLGRRDH